MKTDKGTDLKEVERFFKYSRERHNIYLLRRDGHPAPWTEDKTLQTTGFTNIYRELDRVTIWFRDNIRNPLRDHPFVVPATLIFRWFNRITTGEVIAPMLREGRWDGAEAEALLRAALPKGPWVTGSYMVHSPYGMDKLKGMIQYSDHMMHWWDNGGKLLFNQGELINRPTMEQAHKLLQYLDGISGFTGYEVVTDLRWTDAINPRDRNSWAHAGPGATRGGSRVAYGGPDRLSQSSKLDQAFLRSLMGDLLKMSRDGYWWPQDHEDWPRWELREVEHTLCEYDKYRRVQTGAGQAKRIFRAERAGPLAPSGLAV